MSPLYFTSASFWYLYSLIETAKANGLEPYRYLVALFKRLPPAQTVDDYEALLPWNIELPDS